MLPRVKPVTRSRGILSILTTAEGFIALLAIAAIAIHLILRYGTHTAGALFGALVFDVPLIVALALGGIPLVVKLTRGLVRGQFSSDLLAGISIVTPIILQRVPGGHARRADAVGRPGARDVRGAQRLVGAGGARAAHAVRRASQVGRHAGRRVRWTTSRSGDLLVVFPHEICPVDGTVVDGHGTMDESYLTGEPYMMSKAPGTAVLSGAINGETALTIRADQTGGRFALRQDHAGDARVRTAPPAAAPARRPARRRIHAARRRHRAHRVGRERRRGPIPERARGRDAVPAAHRHSGGDHRLDLARGAPRHHHQGPGGARADRHLPHRDLRQDGHAHLRAAAADRGGRRARLRTRRGAGAGGEPRALLAPPARRRPSSTPRARADSRCSRRAR